MKTPLKFSVKKLVCFLVFLCMFSCTEYIDKPDHLVEKQKMAEIIADLTINDQVVFIKPGTNLESGTRYILKSHDVKNQDFIASYRYYIVKQKMKGIIEDAQKIIIEKDPKSEKKIKGEEILKEEDLPKLKKGRH